MKNTDRVKIEGISKLLPKVYEYFKDTLGFEEDIQSIKFYTDSNRENIERNTLGIVLGSTGQYNPQTMEIGLYIDDRHPKDILRSFAHELYHHYQNVNGELESEEMFGYVGEGYAQKNDGLRQVEMDAYLKGNIMFRDWEDELKSTNTELFNETLGKKESVGSLLIESRSYNQDEALMNGNNIENLEGIRDMMIGSGSADDQILIQFDDIFKGHFSDILDDYNFDLEGSEVGYAYDFRNGNSSITIFPFGQSGLLTRFNPTGGTEESKIYLQTEITDPESKEAHIYGKSFKNFKSLEKYINAILKGE